MRLRIAIPLALWCASLAGAAEERWDASALERVKAYLNLSDSQAALFQQALDKGSQAASAVESQIEQQRGALEKAYAAGDAVAAGKLMIQEAALRKQAAQARAAMRQQMLAALTTDQRAKLNQLQEASRLGRTIAVFREAGLITAEESVGRVGGGGAPGGRERR